MLKPAICYKAESEKALAEYFYTNDMMYYQGCINSYLIEISDKGENTMVLILYGKRENPLADGTHQSTCQKKPPVSGLR